MSKIVQLKVGEENVYPKTIDNIILSSLGTRTGVVQIGKLLIQWGEAIITPVPNTPTSETVYFEKKYKYVPTVITTPLTSVPGTTVTQSATIGITIEKFDAYVTRTSTTATHVMWIAIGEIAD